MRQRPRRRGKPLFPPLLKALGALCCLAPVCVWFCVCVCVFVCAHAAGTDNRLAMAVKAAFVFKFQIYVSWPPAAFPSADAPFLLCIVGDAPGADLIERAIQGQVHDGHQIEVRRLAVLTAASHCHEAIIGSQDPRFIRAQLGAASSFATLTITDTRSPVRGVINFIIENDNVRFAIDEAYAARLHLSISSKLLRLAVAATEG